MPETLVADTAIPNADAAKKTVEQKPVEKPAEQKPAVEEKPVDKPVEQKPEPAKPEPERKADEQKPAESKAPEKYALTVPAGGRLDASDLAQIETLAKANGWSNDDAQGYAEEVDAHLKAQTDRWLTETTADPTYGGDHLATSQQRAKAVIARVRPEGHPRREAFLRFLNRGGAGNHLEVVAFLADLGKLMAEDTPSGSSSAGGGEQKSLAERLYPNMAQG